MQCTDFLFPGTATNISGWAGVDNIKADDGATASGPGSSTSTLRATNFGFAIPAGATLTSITARINRYSNISGVTDVTVQLTKDDSTGFGANMASGSTWPTTLTAQLYSFDVTGISAADINASTFGLIFAAVGSPGIGPLVDSISMQVCWIPGSAGSSSSSGSSGSSVGSSSSSSRSSGNGSSSGSSRSSRSSGSSSSSSSGGTCSGCSSVPSTFDVTFSGVSNGGCADCTGLNGTFTATWVSNCLWRFTTPFTVCGGLAIIEVQYNGAAAAVVMENSAGLTVSYSATGCPTAGMTLSLNTHTGGCSFPPTVTLS